MEISKIDKNFAVNGILTGGEFVSIDNEPFKIYGVMKDEKGYYRIDVDVANATSDGVVGLNRHTAGGIIRFATNSKNLAIKGRSVEGGVMPHMAALGSNGFSVYEGHNLLASYYPTIQPTTICEEKPLRYSENTITADGFHEITIYMPLYGALDDIMVKVDEGAQIRAAKNFRNEKPVVFYGSSITQGGCASSPAMAFTNIISRDLDIQCLNLGFSGNAKGEEAIVNYMADLEMSAFVLDYDHNSPSVEHLQATHSKVYQAVRSKNPDLPIVMASSIPVIGWPSHYQKGRRDVVYATYKAAVEAGDKNVYFLDGCEFFTEDMPFDNCTVDGCHPNDLGMYLMARGFERVLSKLNL